MIWSKMSDLRYPQAFAAPPEWVAWQPLIAALAAVAAALIANTILEWVRQSLSHRHKAQVVRRALLSELRLIRETARGNMEPVSAPQPGQMAMVPLIKSYPLFDSVVGDIGYLTIKEATLVYTAYSFFYDIPRRLHIVGAPQPLMESVALPFAAHSIFVGLCKGIDHRAHDAIIAIEKHLS